MALEGWSEFNVAIAGASAALAGLIIVAISVNVSKIIASRGLPSRAAASISALVLAVIACGLGLIPGQPVWAIGLELIVPTAIVVGIEVHSVRVIRTESVPEVTARELTGKIVAGLFAPLAFTVGTVILLFGIPGGFIAIAIGCFFAIASGVLFSWIALVEVLR